MQWCIYMIEEMTEIYPPLDFFLVYITALACRYEKIIIFKTFYE